MTYYSCDANMLYIGMTTRRHMKNDNFKVIRAYNTEYKTNIQEYSKYGIKISLKMKIKARVKFVTKRFGNTTSVIIISSNRVGRLKLKELKFMKFSSFNFPL